MNRANRIKGVALLGLLMMASPVMAAMIQGTVNISGSGTLDLAPTATPPGATQLTMSSSGNVVGGATPPSGDFDTFLDPLDAITFSTTTVTFQPVFNGSVANFWSGGGFSFQLTSLAEAVEINGFINLVGSGVLTGNTFDPTDARINITGTGGTANVSISTETVPEPLTLGLVGLGLVGIGATRRMRKKV